MSAADTRRHSGRHLVCYPSGHEGKEVTGSVQCSAMERFHLGKASMTVHEGKQDTGLVQCCAVEIFHEGKASMTVQRETASEQYVCFSQGQAKCAA